MAVIDLGIPLKVKRRIQEAHMNPRAVYVLIPRFWSCIPEFHFCFKAFEDFDSISRTYLSPNDIVYD